MAAYTAAVTSAMKKALKIDQVVGVGIFVGRVDLTNYNAVLVAITAISGKFKSIIGVIGGTTEGGEWVEWVAASNSFKAYISNATTGITEEVTDDVDVGEFDFVAIGFL